MKETLFILLVLLFVSSTAQNKVSKQQTLDDIDHFNKTVLEVHYDPFTWISKDKYFHNVEALKNSIGDSIDKKDLVLKLYQLSALINDSHTSPSFIQSSFKNEFKNKLFFPYALVRESNKIYLPMSSANMLHMECGSQLISINAYKLNDLLKEFDRCFGGNTDYAQEMTLRLFPYLLFLKKIDPPFKLEYIFNNSRSTVVIQEGFTFKNALMQTIPSLSIAYDFKIINNKLGLLHFNSMSVNLNAFDHYVDSCVTLMKKKNIQYWAIDLRNNSGGNSMLADVLISYFNTNSYSLMGKRKWRISQLYKNYLINQGDSTHEYLTQKNGTLWTLGNCEAQKPMFENTNLFTGKIFLITGPFTFSSATMFADGVKTYKMGKLVGSKTGENTNDFGEVYSFDLPNSKLSIQTTSAFDIGTSCEEQKFEPLTPDVTIKMQLSDRLKEEDHLIQEILKMIP